MSTNHAEGYGGVEFNPVTGEITDVRLFETVAARAEWMGEAPSWRQARRLGKAEWLMAERAAGRALLPVLNHNGRVIAHDANALPPMLTPDDWRAALGAAELLMKFSVEQLGQHHPQVPAFGQALRELFEAVEADYDARLEWHRAQERT